jgi:hypothetical protein
MSEVQLFSYSISEKQYKFLSTDIKRAGFLTLKAAGVNKGRYENLQHRNLTLCFAPARYVATFTN